MCSSLETSCFFMFLVEMDTIKRFYCSQNGAFVVS